MGLNWIEGNVNKIKKTNQNLKIPHMGWNNLQIKKENFFIKKLMEKIDTPEISAYFVHSQATLKQKIPKINLCLHFTVKRLQQWWLKKYYWSSISSGKSHKFGIKFLETFIEIKDF